VSENRRVLVTRSASQAGALAEALREAGLEPVLVPALAFEAPSSFAVLDAALAGIDGFDWLVLTSANAAEALAARAAALYPERGWPPLKVAAVGAATARAAEASLGLAVTLQSPEPVADSLAAALTALARNGHGAAARFLLVRAEEGREVIERALADAGAQVSVAAAYRTVAPAESLQALAEMAERGDWPAAVTFTSPSSVRNLLGLLEMAGHGLPVSVRRISIGPITSRAMRELGIPADGEAAEPAPAALARAVRDALG
jgi:uroporphyrinogen-III synthase